jgi:hypothetical protein
MRNAATAFRHASPSEPNPPPINGKRLARMTSKKIRCGNLLVQDFFKTVSCFGAARVYCAQSGEVFSYGLAFADSP